MYYSCLYIHKIWLFISHNATSLYTLFIQADNMFQPIFLRPSSGQSQLWLENKLLVYKVILKPVWTYGIQLWGTASNSNLEIFERFQSKVLRIITDVPWYIPNTIIKRDLQIPTVKQEAQKYSANYQKWLDIHPNNLANALFQEQLGTRRLKILYPADLVTNG
jgi:hypothetical protein